MHIFRVSFNVALIVQSLILVVDSRPRRATARIGWWGRGENADSLGCGTCPKVLGQERVWRKDPCPTAVWRTHPQLDTCGKLMWTERRLWVWCPPNTFFLRFSLYESTQRKTDPLSRRKGVTEKKKLSRGIGIYRYYAVREPRHKAGRNHSAFRDRMKVKVGKSECCRGFCELRSRIWGSWLKVISGFL